MPNPLPLLTLLLALAPLQTTAHELTAKVISIADGDTLTVLLADKTTERIRLAGIDAPEKKQAFSAKARAALSKLAKGETVRVEWTVRDNRERPLGDVYLDGKWLNLEMLEQGLAWHYLEFSKDKRLAAAEARARKAKRGLWAEADPMPPWEFRKLQKHKRAMAKGELTYWLNTSTGVRHNSSCRWHGKTKRGKVCGAEDGDACGVCGG